MWVLLGGFVLLTAMALGSAPLYAFYCRATGYAGTPHIASAFTGVPLDRTVKVTLNGDVASGLPWRFAPVEREVAVRLGQPVTVHFRATNLSDKPTVARAVSSITSDEIAVFVNEMQCFCFSEQMLLPGETKDFAVTFFVDSKLAEIHGLDGLTRISLSYSLFAARTETARAMLARFDGNGVGR